MKHRQDIVSSLILVPIRSGLRGFCLFILEIFSMDYQQKNPLKYYALPYFRLVGFAKAKRYRKINFFTTSALCKCILGVKDLKSCLRFLILSSLKARIFVNQLPL